MRGWRRWVELGLPPVVDAACRRLYRVDRRGLENFSRSPSTLIVANHRRDSDALLIAGLFLDRKGFAVRGRLPYFVAREDLFARGFLRDYLEEWPPAIREMLAWIDVGPVLRAGHAHPMRRVPELTLREALEDVLHVLGDRPLDEVVRPAWVAQFERLASPTQRPLRVNDALGRRFHPLLCQRYGLGRLRRDCLRAIIPLERQVIGSQLHLFVELLERGHWLLLEPEGLVSVTGEFLRIRRGIHVLLNEPRTSVRVLPVGICYDFMTVGRQPVFVSAGRELLGLKGASRRQVSEKVTEAILRQVTVTMSQLASRYLFEAHQNGARIISSRDLLEAVRADARRYARLGIRVDPVLLDDAACRRRLTSYLAFCRRRGILAPLGSGRWTVNGHCSESGACFSDPEGAIPYARNELRSLERIYPALAEHSGG